MISAISAPDLESMLWTNTKNIAHEIVSYLIDVRGGSKGILTDIIWWLSKNQNQMVLAETKDLNFGILKQLSNGNKNEVYAKQKRWIII